MRTLGRPWRKPLTPKPPMPYPGGKYRPAFIFTVTTTVGYEWVEAEERAASGGDREYREPFLGGGGSLLRNVRYLRNILKIDRPRVWLNDADPSVASVWTALIRYPNEVIRAFLPSMLSPSPALYTALKTGCDRLKRVPSDRTDLIEAAKNRLYLAHWSRSGNRLAGFCDPTDHAAKRRPYPDPDNLRAVARFLAGLCIRDEQCTCLDFAEVIGTPGPALIYADPPYVQAGRQLYTLWFTEADHRRLAACLRATPNPWVLSYDDAPLVAELYLRREHAACASVVKSHMVNPVERRRVGRREMVITPLPPQ